MPSYYVARKGRCKLSCPAVRPTPTETLFKARSSSVNTKRLSSLTAIKNYSNQTQAQKNNGNVQKRGSGGNSYAAYLARKVGGQIAQRVTDPQPDCC